MTVKTLQPAANRSRVQELAREGLSRQGGQTWENARKIGGRYLDTIQKEAGDSLDGTVAGAARKAAAKYLYPESAYHTQKFALRALAAGVGGPIGPALASVGYDGMYKTIWHEASMAYHDGRSIGATFLDEVRDSSQQETEKELARVARKTAGQYLYNETAFKIEAEALKRIKQGLEGDSLAEALAGFGKAARMKAANNEEARKVAYPILDAIAATDDSRAAVLGEVGRNASGAYLHQDAGSLAQAVAFSKVLERSKGTLAQDLADYGTRALDHCRYAEDQRNLGHEILRGIARHAEDPATRLLAQTADRSTCPRLYNKSAAGAQYEAFRLLAEGGQPDGTSLLARYGLAVLGRGDAAGDGRTIGQEVLGALAENETDEVKKNVLESALELSRKAGTDSAAAGIQKFAFNWIRKAPSLPKADTAGGKEGDAAVLEQRIQLNTSVLEILQGEADRHRREMTRAEVEMASLADRFNPMVDQDRKLMTRAKRARWAFLAGAGLTVGGYVATSLLPPALAPWMLGIGIATGAAGWLIGKQTAARRSVIDRDFWPVRKAYDRLDGEQQARRAIVAANGSIATQLENVIQRDQSSLEVHQMSRAVKEPPSGAGKIEVEAEEVTIGGIKIARRPSQGPEADAPAVSSDGAAANRAEPLPEVRSGGGSAQSGDS